MNDRITPRERLEINQTSDGPEYARINGVAMVALVVGISFISVMVTKCVYTPKPAEVDYVVREAEFHKLRLRHCGPNTWCFVDKDPGPQARFIDQNGREGWFK